MLKDEAFGVNCKVEFDEDEVSISVTADDGAPLTTDQAFVGVCEAFCEAMTLLGRDPKTALKSYFKEFGISQVDPPGSGYKQ